MTDGGSRSRRPSEVQVVEQLADMREEVFDGIDSRRAVLEWGQRLTVRTLGQVPTKRYRELADSFKPDGNAMEGPLLAGLLTEDARTRDLPEQSVAAIRERWTASTTAKAQVHAFRAMRANATEYIGDTDTEESRRRDEDPGYDPSDQDYAMRPALRELSGYQRTALATALDGLDEKADILEWGDQLAKATRGEPVIGLQVGEFVPACYRDERTAHILTRDGDAAERARQYYVGHWLLPAFNRAAADLSRRATEEPTEDDGPNHGPGGVA